MKTKFSILYYSTIKRKTSICRKWWSKMIFTWTLFQVPRIIRGKTVN